MKKRLHISLAILAALIAAPALAAAPAKDALMQQTVALGNNRFLIFVGSHNENQNGYTADLVKIESGVPHFEPVFMEDYDMDSNSASLSNGVAFLAENYHFDKDAHELTFTAIDPEKHTHYQYRYRFAADIFTLQEVVAQDDAPCPAAPCKPAPPHTLFNVADHAKKN